MVLAVHVKRFGSDKKLSKSIARLRHYNAYKYYCNEYTYIVHTIMCPSMFPQTNMVCFAQYK